MIHIKFYEDNFQMISRALEAFGVKEVAPVTTKPECYFADATGIYNHDLAVFEAKIDYKTQKTGNVFFELGTAKWGNFYPSQHNTEYWIFLTPPEGAYLIASRNLLRSIEEPDFRWIQVKNHIEGKLWFSQGVLVPLDWLAIQSSYQEVRYD